MCCCVVSKIQTTPPGRGFGPGLHGTISWGLLYSVRVCFPWGVNAGICNLSDTHLITITFIFCWVFSLCLVPQRYRSVRSASMGRTARLRTARRRSMCGLRRGKALWVESCCLILWAAQRGGHWVSPDFCSSTWACSCSSVRSDHSLLYISSLDSLAFVKVEMDLHSSALTFFLNRNALTVNLASSANAAKKTWRSVQISQLDTRLTITSECNRFTVSLLCWSNWFSNQFSFF